ncbi:transposase [Streptomyces misionensis]|uniref:Transposase n=1 Tax=Streptomyces misionensis TaxID=67331 RepID=A0A5C6K5M1_9ACTN|nr:transposase [Streptomyces misionensis]TWV58410.1 transposase [Streptomyces misionensis]
MRGRRRPADGRADFTAFTQRLFGHLHRVDQQRWGQVYLQGLLATPGKKTLRRMAEAVTSSPTASQSLQQFVNASPWDWDVTRSELVRWTGERLTVRAWTLAPTVLPKRGAHSVGVHRRFVREQGRIVNCQLGLALFLSGEEGQVPVDWRLHLPEQWVGDAEARRRARIPEETRQQALWAQALDLVDGLAAQPGLVRAPVVADLTGVTDVRPLIERPHGRGHGFVLAVSGQLPLAPAPEPYIGRAQHEPLPPLSARQLLLRDGIRHPDVAVTVGPDGRPRRIQVISSPAEIPGLRPGHGRVPSVGRVFAEWDPVRKLPRRIWLTNLPERRMADLLALASLHARTLTTVSALGEHGGLLDFEGRSFPGWHRHMTLVSAAHAYGLLSRPVLHHRPEREAA